MFAQYLHNPTIRREVIIDGNNFFLEGTVLHFKNIPEPVRIGFIRTEEAEILLRSISGKNVAHHLTKLTGRLTVFFCWLFDFNCIVRKGWQVQVVNVPARQKALPAYNCASTLQVFSNGWDLPSHLLPVPGANGTCPRREGHPPLSV